METSARHVPATISQQASASEIKAYQAAIGGIMFAMLVTRPDLAFAVSTLSRFAQNPTKEHERGVDRVLRYLRGTTNHGITYTGTGSHLDEPQLTAYCDSDWASSKEDRRSVSGYAFLMCGGVISWQSKRQKTTALSTVEAEYMAAAAAVKEALWWRTQLSELGFATPTTVVYADNKGCIDLSKNPAHHSNTKHIDIRYHFLRDHVRSGAVHLEYIHTSAMAADALTKALSRDKLREAARLLGMASI
jgi:hypothetical protein